MTDTLYPIPQNWRWTTLEKVCKLIGGGTPNKKIVEYWNGNIFWASVKDIKGDYLFETVDKITEQGLENSSANLCEIDDLILITRIEPAKTIIAKVVTAINQDLKIVKSPLPPKFLHYFFQNFKSQIELLSSGTTVKGITIEKLNNFPIPVPPLAEQKRIVERLDSLFEKLDAAKKILQDIVDGYELRRATILNRAFTGELTEDFRKKNNLSLDDWQEKTLGELLLPMETKRPTGEFFRYIDIESIDNRQQVVRSPKIIETANAPSRASRAVDFDNILFSMVRPYLKNIALIDEKLKDCIASTGFFVCRCNEKIFPQFLYNFLCSEEAINYLMQFMKGDNSPSIRQDDFKSLPLNLPTLEEQKEIARRLDSLLGKENQAKEIAEKLLSEIEKLKKTILSRAFRGELGTNDPSENAVENFEIERE